MKGLLSLAFLILSSSLVIAQKSPTANCPTISVTGLQPMSDLGELATYTATVGDQNSYPIEYVWSVNGGQIKDGQGTRSIRVIRRSNTIVVSVDLKGLPSNCGSSASEAGIYDPAPDPIKIYELQADKMFDKVNATRVAAVMLENPNNQLYILAGDVRRQNSPAFQQKQRTIIDLLGSLGVTRDRITVAPVYSDIELFQFWRVPPGANSPKCEECNELERSWNVCPTISVTGPPGVTEPGEVMDFIGTVAGRVPANATYRWSLSDEGELVEGQGTLRLRVRTPRKSSFNIVATLEVLGLSGGCINSASENAPVACDCIAIFIDEFSRLPLRTQASRIDTAVAEFRRHPGNQLHFIEYFPGATSDRKIRQRVSWIAYELKKRKLLTEDFDVAISESFGPSPLTKIYILPPGAQKPAP